MGNDDGDSRVIFNDLDFQQYLGDLNILDFLKIKPNIDAYKFRGIIWAIIYLCYKYNDDKITFHYQDIVELSQVQQNSLSKYSERIIDVLGKKGMASDSYFLFDFFI